MTAAEIQEKMGQIFKNVFDDEALEITREMTAEDIEDWDSLAQIDLVTGAEAVFGTKFSLSEISALKNVGDMLDLIDKKVNG